MSITLHTPEECGAKAEEARNRALAAKDASTAEEYRQIAKMWDVLAAALEKNKDLTGKR